MSFAATVLADASDSRPVKNTFIHYDADADELPVPQPIKRAQSWPSTCASCAAVCCCLRCPSQAVGTEESYDSWDVESHASFASTASLDELCGWSSEHQAVVDQEIRENTSVCQKTCQHAKTFLLVPYVWWCQSTVATQVPELIGDSSQTMFPTLYQAPAQLNMPLMSSQIVNEKPNQPSVAESCAVTALDAPSPELMDMHPQVHSERIDAGGATSYKKRSAEVTLFKHREDVGIEDSSCAEGFHLLKRLIGPSGQYMKRIADESSGAKVWVSGRGSCRAAEHSKCQKGKDCTGPLAVCISALSQASHDAAVGLVKELLERVRADHARYHRKYSEAANEAHV